MKTRLLPILFLLPLASCQAISLPGIASQSSDSSSTSSSLSTSSLESSDSTSSSETSPSTSEPSSSSETSTSESSASTETSTSSASSDASASDSTSASSSSSEEIWKAPSEEFLALFNPTSSISMRLVFSQESIYALSELGANDQKYRDAYFPADFELTLNGENYSFPDVGVRMKGNTSRRTIVSESGDFYGLCHLKINFGATFDSDMYNDEVLSPFKRDWEKAPRKERKDRNLFGLKKLDLKYVPRNQYPAEDHCVIREIYAFDAFRYQGLPAPYANLASLEINNGVSSTGGRMEIIEPIDKQFLARRFSKEESQGDLYKCVYNGMGKADFDPQGAVDYSKDGNNVSSGTRKAKGKIGVEDNYVYYAPCYQLKTNDDEGEGSDFSKMADFILGMRNLVKGGWGNDISHLYALLDVDEFVRYAAVSYLLANFDDARYNYNNYYVYFLPSNGKAIFIPYDFDWCLGLDCGYSDVNVTAPFDEWTLDGNRPSNPYFATILYGDKDGHITYDKTPMQEAYLNDIDQAIDDGVLDPSNFVSLSELLQNGSEEIGPVTSYMNQKRAAAQEGR